MAGLAGSDFVTHLKDGVCLAVEELLVADGKPRGRRGAETAMQENSKRMT